MAVGDSALLGGLGYLAVGRETTLGTYNTCTAQLDFLSSGIKVQKDSKILQQIERSRTLTKQISLGKSVGGDVEFYFRPLETAPMYLLQNAFGGAITTSTATSETVGGTGFQHIFTTGNMDTSYPSLCINLRKGPSTGGKIFQYNGVRVNEFRVNATLDEPVKTGVALVAFDATSGSSVESALTITANPILSFVNARFSVETSFASLTSTSFWHAQTVDFKIMNNLKTGAESRRIGSDVLTVLPPGLQTYELSCQIRFDTLTAYTAMLNETEFGAQLEFLGPTITGSVARQKLLFDFQKVTIKDAGDPEIGGPDGILTANVTFNVLRSESASGYAVRGIVVNNMSAI